MMRRLLLMLSFTCINSMQALEEGSAPVVIVNEVPCVLQKPGLFKQIGDSVYSTQKWVVGKINGTFWLIGVTTVGLVVYCYYNGQWKEMTIIDKTTDQAIIVSEVFLKTPFGTLCWRLSDIAVELYKNAITAANEVVAHVETGMAELEKLKKEAVTPVVKDICVCTQTILAQAAVKAQCTADKCRALLS